MLLIIFQRDGIFFATSKHTLEKDWLLMTEVLSMILIERCDYIGISLPLRLYIVHTKCLLATEDIMSTVVLVSKDGKDQEKRFRKQRQDRR